MRTIDADALRDKFQNLAYDDWNQGVSTSWANAYNECADIVDDMPTLNRRGCGGSGKPSKDGTEMRYTAVRNVEKNTC